jgi:predicted dehydrogenase
MGSDRPLRVNVIGRGPWGQNIVRTLKELGAEVPIVANRETGWEAAFEESPDGICVAAHPSVNLSVAEEARKRRFAGAKPLRLWLEKPVALSLEDARRLEQIHKSSTRIFVNYTHAFKEDAAGAWADVLAGIVSGRCHDFGMLYDWGPHLLALAHRMDVPKSKRPPLLTALDAFLYGDDWPAFETTVRIHEILDAAEKLHAGR